MVIALEGLPGVGKTTTAGLLAQRLDVPALRETTANHPFLQQVYDDAARDDLTIELAFLVVHANPYRRLDRDALTICDFSPVKDRLFAEEMLADDDLLLFNTVYDHAYRDHPRPDLVVYMRAEPAMCFERIQRRMLLDPSREFERGMTIDRLQHMRDRYDTGYERLGGEAFVFDVTPDLDEVDVTQSVAALLDARLSSPLP